MVEESCAFLTLNNLGRRRRASGAIASSMHQKLAHWWGVFFSFDPVCMNTNKYRNEAVKQCCVTHQVCRYSPWHRKQSDTLHVIPPLLQQYTLPNFCMSQIYSLQASLINLRSSVKPQSSTSNRYATSGLAQSSRYTCRSFNHATT